MTDDGSADSGAADGRGTLSVNSSSSHEEENQETCDSCEIPGTTDESEKQNETPMQGENKERTDFPKPDEKSNKSNSITTFSDLFIPDQEMMSTDLVEVEKNSTNDLTRKQVTSKGDTVVFRSKMDNSSKQALEAPSVKSDEERQIESSDRVCQESASRLLVDPETTKATSFDKNDITTVSSAATKGTLSPQDVSIAKNKEQVKEKSAVDDSPYCTPAGGITDWSSQAQGIEKDKEGNKDQEIEEGLHLVVSEECPQSQQDVFIPHETEDTTQQLGAVAVSFSGSSNNSASLPLSGQGSNGQGYHETNIVVSNASNNIVVPHAVLVVEREDNHVVARAELKQDQKFFGKRCIAVAIILLIGVGVGTFLGIFLRLKSPDPVPQVESNTGSDSAGSAGSFYPSSAPSSSPSTAPSSAPSLSPSSLPTVTPIPTIKFVIRNGTHKNLTLLGSYMESGQIESAPSLIRPKEYGEGMLVTTPDEGRISGAVVYNWNDERERMVFVLENTDGVFCNRHGIRYYWQNKRDMQWLYYNTPSKCAGVPESQTSNNWFHYTSDITEGVNATASFTLDT